MVLRVEHIPERFNVTTWFLDRNLDIGRGARTALVGESGHTTYAELAALTNRVGNVLRECGVQPGNRVLLALSDGVEFVATWLATLKIGAVTAEVYTYLPARDYTYYLGYTEATVVVVDEVTLDRVRDAMAQSSVRPHLLVLGDVELRPGEHHFDTLVSQADDVLDATPTSRDDMAIWKFTTGSTGAPKACVHPMSSPRLNFEWYGRGVLGLNEDDLVLPVPKLFFGYPRDLAALYPFAVGGAGIVFPQRTTPDRVFELVHRHRPTILVNVPTMMSAMVNHPAAADQDLACLRLCTSAGEALPAELHRRWTRTFGVGIVDGIGSSEAYHIYISHRPGRSRVGSLGQLVPGYRARIVDGEGNPVPDGQVGVLELSGATVARGYWGDAERTARTFSADTVRTGDLFSRDREGFFRYHGRADDLLKVGGVWVAPSEVEHCLLDHPDVVDCAVVGRQVEGLTSTHAYVVLRDGATASTALAAGLQAFVRSRLSPHKYPRAVSFVGELPRTAAGKLDRRALRERDTEGSEAP
ncbi:benzoate--CoA ligase [Longimycelium tulufanense]|uniref:Benzoate--CoA ligase n=1 Tax=Longimycelium tulufanense TaxID=907463 RepID=A0A8J3CE23_9PSEU|nr:benzoate-CoA ligase family protein [Longimycelium tulufanense]GGM46662.1 benzoate--CoA ligase [Longimycelium tulufanense]